MTTMNLPTTIVFSDINLDVHSKSPFEVVYNEEAIRKSLETIFTTPYGSRVFRRRFGTKLMDLMHEPVDSTTATLMETMLKETATAWERRIAGLTIKVLPDAKNQQYYVEMGYTIPDLGNKMVNYKFNISR